jgi:bla regulator protein BlaR1
MNYIIGEINKLSFFISPVFYTLVYLSITATIIGGLILIILKIADKKISPNWKYVMWAVFLIALIIPVRLESNFSLFSNIDIAKVQEISYRQAYDNVMNEEFILKQTEPQEIKITQLQMNKKLAELRVAKNITYIKSLIFDVTFPLLWLFGTLSLFSLMIFGAFRLKRRIYQNSVDIDSLELQTLLKKCKQRLNINKNIEIIVQDYIKTPVLLGLFCPKIILPKFILEMNEQTREYIILHELVHFKRSDMLINYLLLILQAIYWFNPLTWLFVKLIRQDLELATDAYVLNCVDKVNHKQYSLSLVEVLARYNKSTLVPELLCMVDSEKNLVRRIKMIKLNEMFKKKKLLIGIASVLIIVIVSLVFLTTGHIGYERANKYNFLIGGQFSNMQNREPTFHLPQEYEYVGYSQFKEERFVSKVCFPYNNDVYYLFQSFGTNYIDRTYPAIYKEASDKKLAFLWEKPQGYFILDNYLYYVYGREQNHVREFSFGFLNGHEFFNYSNYKDYHFARLNLETMENENIAREQFEKQYYAVKSKIGWT